ncbi:hypothetical protein C8R47DRAFT_1222567 [Mycena vitilis]|nr:hypothetical protein C8R47DRAFT_1222567 [Mycena vitilis]
MAPGKRKAFVSEIDEEDINDGSDSDNEIEGYVARNREPRVHLVPDETISFGENGALRSTFTSVRTPASPAKKSRLPAERPPSPVADRTGWLEDYSEFDAEYGLGVQQPPRDARASDNPNEQWATDDRETFLDELVRLDGRVEASSQISCGTEGCKSTDFPFRCLDCFGSSLFCKGCIQSIHWRMPLHRIEEWKGSSFKPRSLKSLDVRIQLGHPLGDPCYNASKAHGDAFVIVSAHGIHEVGLDYCNCGNAQTKPIQLLRMRLYPATGTNPRSAATFAGLDRFDHMALESKCSAYEFYNSLARETDNTGTEPSRERYEEFLRMTRQWQHLALLKRAGRAHSMDADRINDTKAGELALLCPACPQPGKNLPEGWENVPFERSFLYALFLGIDANFRLKRRDVSSETKDPGLGTGWAYFGEVKAYMAHLDKYWDQKQDRSTCVAHDAVDKPDRESLGTASSGIGTVDCARHNMKRPNGVGDLQKGERYLNMDYLFFMSLAGSTVYRLFVSYDIACQWHKKLWGRMKEFVQYGVEFKDGTKWVVFLVPKFHLPAHIELCNILFSFNLTPYVGRTDGEAPERGWADANRLANSTSISGPGARRDTLDVHFQYWNWKKVVGLGATLLNRIQTAGPLMLETHAAWVDFERSFPPSVLAAWLDMAVSWERDDRKPNPFASKVKHESLAQVRRDLATVASEDVKNERVRGDMHETEMLSMGLQLEGSQRALATHVKHVGAHETLDQGRRRIDQETKLRRKIEAFMVVQQLFIPEVTLLREQDDLARKRVAATQTLAGVRAQDMKLYMPSAIGARAQCDETLQDYEYQLRKGQAFAALDAIRAQLIVRTREYHFKDANRSHKIKTRSQSRIKGIQARMEEAQAEYRAARSALVSLGVVLKRTEWQAQLKELKEIDVRPRPSQLFGDVDRQKGGSKKKKQRLGPEEEARRVEQEALSKMGISWIWVVQDGSETPEKIEHNEILRIEWAKMRAKAMRYAEEVDLLEEEMRRVTQFLDGRADWWMSLVGLRAALQPDAALREGHRAYAEKQAGYTTALSARFSKMWKDVPEFLVGLRRTYASLQEDDSDSDSASGSEVEEE